MSRSFGRAPCTATCTKCGTEVAFFYWWDRETNACGYEDTEHEAPDGSRCDLSDADCGELDAGEYDCEYGGDGPDD